MSVRICAWKKCREGKAKTPCPLEDPDAFVWEISYSGTKYSTTTLDCNSLFRAQEVQRALECSFKAGGKAKLAELRAFIGV